MAQEDKALLREKYHRELARRAEQMVVAINPTDTDFTVYWDGYGYTIPSTNRDMGFGKGKRNVPFYIFRHYAKNMMDHMLTQEAERIVREENARRVEAGLEPMNSKMQVKIEPKVNDKNKRAAILPTLYGGIVKGYSEDIRPDRESKARGDVRTVEDTMFDSLFEQSSLDVGGIERPKKTKDDLLKEVSA